MEITYQSCLVLNMGSVYTLCCYTGTFFLSQMKKSIAHSNDDTFCQHLEDDCFVWALRRGMAWRYSDEESEFEVFTNWHHAMNTNKVD